MDITTSKAEVARQTFLGLRVLFVSTCQARSPTSIWHPLGYDPAELQHSQSHECEAL
jgi:hypothetical protein